jgi:hypothetical protein
LADMNEQMFELTTEVITMISRLEANLTVLSSRTLSSEDTSIKHAERLVKLEENHTTLIEVLVRLAENEKMLIQLLRRRENGEAANGGE